MNHSSSSAACLRTILFAGRRSRATVALLAALVGLAAQPAEAAREPQPGVVIPLTSLGYESPRPELLAIGSAMATLDYVDATHLLVTFGVRRLIPRDPADPPNDDDRMVGAFLIEQPSGKVVAQTEWHLHDRGQYLWNVGDGRFLLRVRDRLALLEPGAAQKPQDAFQARDFLHFTRKIIAISVSAERDLLVVQTEDPPVPAVILADGDAAAGRAPVQVNFYRLLHRPDHLIANPAGQIGAPGALALPVSADGFMDAVPTKRGAWQFHFVTPAGKATDLAAFDTTCYPHVTLVSQAEFIAFGCRGSEDHHSIAGFDMNGKFMWEQGFFSTYVNPTFAFAPGAGRFAIGRTLINSSSGDASELTPAEITGQNVRVYQTSSGKVLLDLSCLPAMRSGQNFALSPDGMHLAVLRETTVQHKRTALYDAYTSQQAAVEIFNLPPLSVADKAALAALPKFSAPQNMPRIDQAIATAVHRYPAPYDGSTAAPAPPPAPIAAPVPVSSLASQTAPSASPQQNASPHPDTRGDLQPQQTRKPPTLYAPGEKPEQDSQSDGGST